MRHLVLVLGDQLDRASHLLESLDPERDAIWIAEAAGEATLVRNHRLRLAFFFSAMRHFRDELRAAGFPVHYHELTSDTGQDRGHSLAEILSLDLARLSPSKLLVVQPGDHRVLEALHAVSRDSGIELEVHEDRHFYSTPGEFAEFARGRRRLILEDFYRRMRRIHAVLIDPEGAPVGGAWNFDRSNRESFGDRGPRDLPRPLGFSPDRITRDVVRLVEDRFADHPGTLDSFDLPVTREDALRMLSGFMETALPNFGRYQDAMVSGEPFLYHSRLSAALNVKLISPRECVDAAVNAYRKGRAPIESVEGFVRQILGWREFVRGIYWLHMPQYAHHNHLEHRLPLPEFYWTGDTDLACVQDALRSVREFGYAHHIQRLMVLGLLALLYGVNPYRFHEWHMAMYVDAIDWVSLPNTLGMSQFGDGGIVGTKPYCASGRYIDRMSDHCHTCRYRPDRATGEDACPFTALYWDFLARHETKLSGHPRMGFQYRNLARKRNRCELAAIRERAEQLRQDWSGGTAG